ncbi:MAG: hypothetical protein IJU96_02970 [Clostridia bacterium]|nr:hypothetical protein [Clostridia bacterium]
MKLSAYDGQCVRVTLKDGSVLEGACQYNSAEFNEAEIGPDEDGLEIAHWLFCQSEIETVELIDENNPYRAPFGTIEEETLLNGLYAIMDVLIYDEEPRNAERLLNCMEYYLSRPTDSVPFGRLTAKEVLAQAVQNAPDDGIRQRCSALLARYFSEP